MRLTAMQRFVAVDTAAYIRVITVVSSLVDLGDAYGHNCRCDGCYGMAIIILDLEEFLIDVVTSV